MMSLTDTVRRLVAAGANAEVIAIAIEAIEAERAVLSAARDAAKERKRRQRSRDSHGTVTGQSVTEDVTDRDDPRPLPSSPQTPQQPTPTPGDITPRARKGPDRKLIAEGFVAFWQAYPLRKGKEAAARAFEKALTRIDDPDPLGVILSGIERCQLEWDDPKYIPYPATWLNQGRWADEETPQPTHAPRARHDRPYRSDRAEQRDVWADILAESDPAYAGGSEPLRITGGLHEGA